MHERTIEGLFERPILLERVPDPLPRVYVVGASPGGFGTILAQNGWLPVSLAVTSM
mgnify:CR=1 FL=1